VPSMPLVGAEIQRIHDAFHRVSLELSGVVTVIGELDASSIGTPSCDPAVETGVADLRTALTGLQQVSADCLVAMTRHGAVEETRPAAPTAYEGLSSEERGDQSGFDADVPTQPYAWRADEPGQRP